MAWSGTVVLLTQTSVVGNRGRVPPPHERGEKEVESLGMAPFSFPIIHSGLAQSQASSRGDHGGLSWTCLFQPARSRKGRELAALGGMRKKKRKSHGPSTDPNWGQVRSPHSYLETPAQREGGSMRWQFVSRSPLKPRHFVSDSTPPS